MTIQQQVTKGEWENEFSSGKWNGLEFSPLERARHAVIGMFLQHFSPEGEILDVGCGLGTTTDFLNLNQKSRYLGIDISETAISEARKSKNANFTVTDFLQFPTERKFDVILFNEVLYYLEEEAAIRHAVKLLKENGLIVISLYSQKKMHYNDMAIWNLSRKFFTPMEKIEIRGVVADGRLVTWRIEVLSLGANKQPVEKQSASDFLFKRIRTGFSRFYRKLSKNLSSN